MNITIKENKNSKNKQPKIYDLGSVTTTIQDLLDSSSIVINGEQPIILKIGGDNYLLNLKDYNSNDVYGLGKDVLQSDLIAVGGGGGGTGDLQSVLDNGSVATYNGGDDIYYFSPIVTQIGHSDTDYAGLIGLSRDLFSAEVVNYTTNERSDLRVREEGIQICTRNIGDNAYYLSLRSDNLTDNRTRQLANVSGNEVISVENSFADANGNINLEDIDVNNIVVQQDLIISGNLIANTVAINGETNISDNLFVNGTVDTTDLNVVNSTSLAGNIQIVSFLDGSGNRNIGVDLNGYVILYDGVVSNSTATALSLSQLNTQYPTASFGFKVQCLSISGGALIYEKSTSGWISYSVNIIT